MGEGDGMAKKNDKGGDGRMGTSSASGIPGPKKMAPPNLDHLRRTDRADAFLPDPGDGPAQVDDDLAETLAEEYLHSATSGEETTEDALDQVVPEEIGGPFIETTGADEFAAGTDDSNPEDAEPEPLPRAVSGLARSPDDE
jgi:hypothetical protein